MDTSTHYARYLSCLNHGYALFEPDPASCDFDQVRVGDVGYVQDGAFCRLFNVCVSSDDPINTLGVPTGFEPLPERFRKLQRRTTLPPGLMSSRSVRRVGGNINVSSNSNSP